MGSFLETGSAACSRNQSRSANEIARCGKALDPSRAWEIARLVESHGDDMGAEFSRLCGCVVVG